MPTCASWKRGGSGEAGQGAQEEGSQALRGLRWPPPCSHNVWPVSYLGSSWFCPLVPSTPGQLSSSPLPGRLHQLPASLLPSPVHPPCRSWSSSDLSLLSLAEQSPPHGSPAPRVRGKLLSEVHTASLIGPCQPPPSHLPQEPPLLTHVHSVHHSHLALSLNTPTLHF